MVDVGHAPERGWVEKILRMMTEEVLNFVEVRVAFLSNKVAVHGRDCAHVRARDHGHADVGADAPRLPQAALELDRTSLEVEAQRDYLGVARSTDLVAHHLDVEGATLAGWKAVDPSH